MVKWPPEKISKPEYRKKEEEEEEEKGGRKEFSATAK